MGEAPEEQSSRDGERRGSLKQEKGSELDEPSRARPST
jgi:hypothetical protein